jgi:hypothetical protein
LRRERRLYDNGVHEHCVDDGCTNNTTDTTLDYMAFIYDRRHGALGWRFGLSSLHNMHNLVSVEISRRSNAFLVEL